MVSSGGYVSSVAGVTEFDYGANSGWLFTVNGDQNILEGTNTYTLSAGDEVVWHYTGDYTEAEGSGTWSETQIKPITVNPVTPTVTYSDVSEDDRFYEAVNWAVGEGLFNGVSETNFAPNDAMTRGMLATVLWRLADAAEGETSAQFDFTDVLHGAWYSDAVNWAAGNNMMGGYGNGLARRAPDGTWSYFDSGAGLPDDRVSDLALDTDGSLWVACDRAAARIAGGAVVQVLDNMNGPPGTVLSVAIDDVAKPRRVIVGTSQGVGIYDGP
jgi:hypothetical protein